MATCLWVAVALSMGCDATTRHRVLTFFFDGVPPPRPAGESVPAQAGAPAASSTREVGYREHGPYAAKLCNACHNAGTTNVLVAPQENLCSRCHNIQLNKKYIHGPLASGGCLVCHDPHSSQYRYLLVSASDDFCFHCHDRETLAGTGPHGDLQENCTSCHDAHMSDERYLLK